MKLKQVRLRICVLAGVLLSLLMVNGFGAEVIIPGKLDLINDYILKTYAVPGENLIFHLNEMFLLEDIPTYDEMEAIMTRHISSTGRKWRMRREILKELGRARRSTLSARFKQAMFNHRLVKEQVKYLYGAGKSEISINLAARYRWREVEKLLALMGLTIQIRDNEKGDGKQYRLIENKENQYFYLQGINSWKQGRLMQESGKLDIKIFESQVSIPFELDFLSQVTHLQFTARTFIHHFVNERKVQILLGILFRLSDMEIDFITGLSPTAWQRIYKDNDFLGRMFILSHGLRVKGNRLLLPGGDSAETFWHKLTGANPHTETLAFLEQLATREEGKLNFFYTFGFFLPEPVQKVLYCSYNATGFQQLIKPLKLTKKLREKDRIRKLIIPQLNAFGPITLLYALQVRDGKIYFPGGIGMWANAVGVKKANEATIVQALLALCNTPLVIQSFVPLYCRFIDRPQLLNQRVLMLMLNNYIKSGILIDFIEKLPIKKPETIEKLFNWVDKMNAAKIPGRQKKTIIASFQAILEILSYGSAFNPDQYDYDQLLEKLTTVPYLDGKAFDGVLTFLQDQCDVDPDNGDASLMNFFLNGLEPTPVSYRNQEYILDTAYSLKKIVSYVLKKQQVCPLSLIYKMNNLLVRIRNHSTAEQFRYRAGKLLATCEELPVPELQYRKLLETVGQLINRGSEKAKTGKSDAYIAEIKALLFPQLKHLLVTGVYALHMKMSSSRLLLNPNFTRNHDFSLHKKINPWNYSGISRGSKEQPYYHLKGGLSRLNILLATPTAENMFQRGIGKDTTQISPILYNHMFHFPVSQVNKAQAATGFLVDLADQVEKQAATNPVYKEVLKDQLPRITAGYRYRKLMNKLNGEANSDPKRAEEKYIINFSDLLKLGEYLYYNRDKFKLPAVKGMEQYEPSSATPLVRQELSRLGSVWFYTFGRLRPYRFHLFPQPLSHLFDIRWTGGEMIDEFKIKVAYISYMRKMPASMLGHLMYNYLPYSTAYHTQRYRNDYHKSYFIYDIYNYLYLNKIYKSLKKTGVLRIK